MKLLKWDIYEISSKDRIHGVKFRGRIRKYGLLNEINVLTENATDADNSVRFAVISGTDVTGLKKQIKNMAKCSIKLVKKGVVNPVLSKMRVNIEDRYEI
jgi:acylphosphatase